MSALADREEREHENQRTPGRSSRGQAARSAARESACGRAYTVAVLASTRLHGEALARILEGPSVTVTAAVARDTSVCRLLRRHGADVAVLDLGLQRNLLTARLFTAELPELRLLAVSADCDELAASYAEAGVVGWISSDARARQLVAAVETVCRQGAYCSQRAAALLMKRLASQTRSDVQGSLGGLTPRERQLLELVAGGLSNREIARQLTIELSTVKNHVHNILAKLAVASRAEAAELWRRNLAQPQAAADANGARGGGTTAYDASRASKAVSRAISTS